MSLLLSTRGPIDVRFLDENHHKINFIAGENILLSAGVCLFFVNHFLHNITH